MSLQDYLKKYVSEEPQEQGSESDLSETEEGPVIVERKVQSKGWTSVETKETTGPRPNLMQDGSLPGLKTGEDIKRSMEMKQRQLEDEKRKVQQHYDPNNVETVYRDATGRRLSKVEAPDAQRKAEEERKKEEIKRINQSEYTAIQKQKEEHRLKQLETETQESRDHQKKQIVNDDDPALLFDSNLQTRKRKLTNLSATGRKLYAETGYPDNRFGIRPGWRWDGVNRTNGFEQRWFERRQELEQNEVLKYTLQEDI
ncbi:hypothetical protein KL938_000663 [Ogataea parapolymorpha]|nr:hypothetical protein KL938_000663 [Ogataea parapolymorpha]